MAGTAKSTTNRSLIGSHLTDQAVTHPLKKRGAVGFSVGSADPHKEPPNHSRPSQSAGRLCGHWQPHPRCKRGSPRGVSEPPRPKENQSPEPISLSSVSTDNPIYFLLRINRLAGTVCVLWLVSKYFLYRPIGYCLAARNDG